jgi:hypothetical protein
VNNLTSTRLRLLAQDCGWQPEATSRRSPTRHSFIHSRLEKTKDRGDGAGNASASTRRMAKGKQGAQSARTRSLTRGRLPRNRVREISATETRERASRHELGASNGGLTSSTECAIVKRTSRRRTCAHDSWGCDKRSHVLWTRNGCGGIFLCEGLQINCSSAKVGPVKNSCSCI